jgi:hypothetical protein
MTAPKYYPSSKEAWRTFDALRADLTRKRLYLSQAPGDEAVQEEVAKLRRKVDEAVAVIKEVERREIEGLPTGMVQES